MEKNQKTCLINIRADANFRDRLKKVSKKTGISITFITRTAITEYFERNPSLFGVEPECSPGEKAV